MAILSVTRVAPTASASHGDGEKTIHRRYAVVMDAPSDQDAGMFALGVPRRGEAHPSSAGFVVSDVSCEYANQNHYTQFVDVTYKNSLTTLTDGDEDPLERPVERSWSFEQREEEVAVDIDGIPLCNTANEPQTGITRRIAQPVLRVVRNEAVFSPARAVYLSNKVNSDQFQINDDPYEIAFELTCLLNVEQAELLTEGEFTYWRIAYRMEFYDGPPHPTYRWGWRLPLVSMGLHELDDATGRPKEILTVGDYRMPVSTPQYLDAAGHRTTKENAAIQQHRIYDEIPFAPLNLI